MNDAPRQDPVNGNAAACHAPAATRRLLGLDLAPFRPRLLQSLKTYNRQRLLTDVIAGLTVGVVALPLAMAFAIASGVKPEQGIFTAIIAGFIISALGGSSVQIGGPAGAFIVIVYGIVQHHGLTNLLISTALAGVLLFAMGALRLGALVRYVPVSIVIGFTNGIAVLIALSQVKDLLGLTIVKFPADFFSQLRSLVSHLDGFNPHALAVGATSFGILVLWPRLFGARSFIPPHLLEGRTLRTASRVPGPMVALIGLTLACWLLQWPVETIGSRFGGIPLGLPTLALPPFSWASAQQLVVPTLTIAALGAVESLLCARIADNLSTLPRHDPNQELMAQGIANMVVPVFGGIPATGTIARTLTNLRAGATSPVAGMVHALTLLVFVLAAAPLAAHIPLPALAGILLYVAWNMGEWHEFRRLRQFGVQYRIILVGTFLLTVVFDLTVAVQVGLVLACVFFIYRMSTLFSIAPATAASPQGVQVFHLFGALFFGAVAKVEAVGEAIAPSTTTVVLEMHRLVSLDSTGVDALQQLHRHLGRQGVRLLLCDLNPQPHKVIRRSGFATMLGPGGVSADLPAALTEAESPTKGRSPASA
jgi:SulP family sulfate permease